MKLFRKILVFTLVLCGLFPMALTASAAMPNVQPNSCSIAISLGFLNSGEIEDTQLLEAYQANVFQLADSVGRYFQAEYCADTGRYCLTGWTCYESAASHLRCGENDVAPERLIISGLPDGTYFLSHLETAPGFLKISDPIEICISMPNATVNGKPVNVDSSPDDVYIVPLTVIAANTYHLPALYSSNWQMIRESRWIHLAILLVLIACLVVLLVPSTCTGRHPKK